MREEVGELVLWKGHRKLTFPQICVSKSQTVLFASCLSPRDRKFEGDIKINSSGQHNALATVSLRDVLFESNLVALQWRSNQNHGPHGRHNVVRRNVFRLKREEGRQTVVHIYGDKVNTIANHMSGWNKNNNELDNLKAWEHCEPWNGTSRLAWQNTSKIWKFLNLKVYFDWQHFKAGYDKRQYFLTVYNLYGFQRKIQSHGSSILDSKGTGKVSWTG